MGSLWALSEYWIVGTHVRQVQPQRDLRVHTADAELVRLVERRQVEAGRDAGLRLLRIHVDVRRQVRVDQAHAGAEGEVLVHLEAVGAAEREVVRAERAAVIVRGGPALVLTQVEVGEVRAEGAPARDVVLGDGVFVEQPRIELRQPVRGASATPPCLPGTPGPPGSRRSRTPLSGIGTPALPMPAGAAVGLDLEEDDVRAGDLRLRLPGERGREKSPGSSTAGGCRKA